MEIRCIYKIGHAQFNTKEEAENSVKNAYEAFYPDYAGVIRVTCIPHSESQVIMHKKGSYFYSKPDRCFKTFEEAAAIVKNSIEFRIKEAKSEYEEKLTEFNNILDDLTNLKETEDY